MESSRSFMDLDFMIKHIIYFEINCAYCVIYKKCLSTFPPKYTVLEPYAENTLFLMNYPGIFPKMN